MGDPFGFPFEPRSNIGLRDIIIIIIIINIIINIIIINILLLLLYYDYKYIYIYMYVKKIQNTPIWYTYPVLSWRWWYPQ